MPVAARKNTVSEGESPISSVKYNEEINNLYLNLNKSLSFFSGGSAPDEPMLNQYWLDTSVSPAVLRRYDGSVWRWTGIHFGSTPPSNPISGAFFINSDAGTMAFWDGTASEWVSLPGTAIGFDPGDTDLTSTNMEDALREMYVSYADTNAAAIAAQTAKSLAEAARDKAQEWAESDEDVEVEPGEYSAKHWSAKSESHLSSVEAARTGAETARTGAETARTGAETARTGAEAAQTGAVTARTGAETARDRSREWAEKDEDLIVEGMSYSAKHHAAKAGAFASSAATSELLASGHKDAAEGFAEAAESSAEAALAGSIPLWGAGETYDFPDVVTGLDGHIYRCMGSGVASEPSELSPDWARMVLSVEAKATFEYDSEGDLMPGLPLQNSFWWEIDGDGDIMPAA